MSPEEHQAERNFQHANFYKLAAAPVFMATVTKCGCTFLKNLFYFLNTQELHPAGPKIHDHEATLLRASKEDHEAILESPYRFIVMRDPVDRFFSLYFEKIYGQGPHAMAWFQNEVGKKIGLDYTANLDLQGHQENAFRLAQWIEKNLNGETDQEKDFHWRRQSLKYSSVKGFDPTIITLDNLDQKLITLLNPVVPEIVQAIESVPRFNISDKPFSFAEMKTPELTELIKGIYQLDYEKLEAL